MARVDLEAEAVRLARLLVELMPDEPEVLSLLALLLFTSARTPARSDAEGHVVTLANQDRDRWNREAIAEGSRPQYGLAALGAIVGMERSHLWHAALADNLRRLGRTAEAAEELETAAALAPAEGERRLLLSRLLDVRSEAA